jgi:hypothetical protein
MAKPRFWFDHSRTMNVPVSRVHQRPDQGGCSLEVSSGCWEGLSAPKLRQTPFLADPCPPFRGKTTSSIRRQGQATRATRRKSMPNLEKRKGIL